MLESREVSILNLREWPVFAGRPQRPPLSNWRSWLLLGGRGAGKTRAGAEWLKAIIGRDKHFIGDAAGRVAIIGETYSDARAVMIEGESGLLNLYPKGERPAWNPSRRQLVWPDGTIGQVFSASDPEGLRGSQFGAAWLDELAKWRHLEETWDMMQFCLRLGNLPRLMASTTPKPLPLLKRLLVDPYTVVTRSGTKDNAANLAPGFLKYLIDRYGETRLGRQEIEGEIVEDSEAALWRRSVLEEGRCAWPVGLCRIVVAVDPPATSGARSAACGIIGAPFVLFDSGVQPIELTALETGLELYWRVGPADDPISAGTYSQITHTHQNVSRRPYSPVHLKAAKSSNDDIYLSWIRRSRISSDSWDAVEIPLGEADEEYLVEILDEGGSTVRRANVREPEYVYTASEQILDHGQLVSALYCSVAQIASSGLPGTVRRLDVQLL